MICLLDHQQEDAAGDHGHAVVVAPVQSPKAPAAASLDVLQEAVPGAAACVSLNGVTAVLLE